MMIDSTKQSNQKQDSKAQNIGCISSASPQKGGSSAEDTKKNNRKYDKENTAEIRFPIAEETNSN